MQSLGDGASHVLLRLEVGAMSLVLVHVFGCAVAIPRTAHTDMRRVPHGLSDAYTHKGWSGDGPVGQTDIFGRGDDAVFVSALAIGLAGQVTTFRFFTPNGKLYQVEQDVIPNNNCRKGTAVGVPHMVQFGGHGRWWVEISAPRAPRSITVYFTIDGTKYRHIRKGLSVPIEISWTFDKNDPAAIMKLYRSDLPNQPIALPTTQVFKWDATIRSIEWGIEDRSDVSVEWRMTPDKNYYVRISEEYPGHDAISWYKFQIGPFDWMSQSRSPDGVESWSTIQYEPGVGDMNQASSRWRNIPLRVTSKQTLNVGKNR